MVKAKRNKVITLSVVKKVTPERKNNLINKMVDHISKYKFLFVVGVDNISTSYLQGIRTICKPGRFFFAKKTLLVIAIKKYVQENPDSNLSGIIKFITGSRGILLTNKPISEIEKVFEENQEETYAKPGQLATLDLTLTSSEVFKNFPPSIEPEFRKLGIPTVLKNGVIELLGDFTVCQKGTPLTVDSCHILKHLGIKMGIFKMNVVSVYDIHGDRLLT